MSMRFVYPDGLQDELEGDLVVVTNGKKVWVSREGCSLGVFGSSVYEVREANTNNWQQTYIATGLSFASAWSNFAQRLLREYGFMLSVPEECPLTSWYGDEEGTLKAEIVKRGEIHAFVETLDEAHKELTERRDDLLLELQLAPVAHAQYSLALAHLELARVHLRMAAWEHLRSQEVKRKHEQKHG